MKQTIKSEKNKTGRSTVKSTAPAKKLSKTTSISDTSKKSAKQNPKKDPEKNGSERQESLLEKFFFEQLKDIYYAEKQLLKALPKMVKAATTEQLKEAFEDHLHVTQKQIKRLEKIFESTGKKVEGKKCEAIEGLIKETETIIKETKEGTMTRDAALIIAAQKIEHYEIATYGGLVQLAITMGLHNASGLLDKTLMEEEDTDLLLTEIAEAEINIEADEEMAYS